MNRHPLLEELAHRLHIQLNYDVTGATSISFDDDYVEFAPTADGICLLAEIGFATKQADLLRQLLVSNFPGQQATWATVSIDPNFDTFNLHQFVPNHTRYEEFEQILAAFLRTLRELKKTVEQNQSTPSETPDSDMTSFNFINAISV